MYIKIGYRESLNGEREEGITSPALFVRATSLEQCTITSKLCICSWNSVPLMTGTFLERKQQQHTNPSAKALQGEEKNTRVSCMVFLQARHTGGQTLRLHIQKLMGSIQIRNK